MTVKHVMSNDSYFCRSYLVDSRWCWPVVRLWRISMSFRKSVAWVVIVSFVLAALPQPAAAAAMPRTLSGADLHRTVQARQTQVADAHATMQALLGRADVKDQIRKVGLSPQDVSVRVARLSDTEILRLEAQLMQIQSRGETAGLSGGAIAGIIVGASLLIILCVVLLVASVDDAVNNPYYYY